MAWLHIFCEGDSAQRLWMQWIGTCFEEEDSDDGEAGAPATYPAIYPGAPSCRANAY